MRRRLVLPAALLVTVAYVKGCLDSGLLGGGRRTQSTPERDPADPLLRAEAEAADAFALAELETAATRVGARRTDDSIEPTFLSEWATAPGSPPAGPATESVVAEPPGLAEWVAEIAATLAPQPAAETTVAPEPEATVEPEPEATPEPEPEATVEPEPEPEATPEPEPEPETDVAPEPAPVPRPDPKPRPKPRRKPRSKAKAKPEPESVVEVVVDESGRFSLGGWATQAGHMALCGVTFRDRRDRPVDPASIRLIVDAGTNVAEGGTVVLSDAGFAPDAEGFTILLAAAGPGTFAVAGRYEIIAA